MRMSKYLQTKISSLRASDRGLAAIEFALVAPMLFALFLGVASLHSKGNAVKDVQRATSALTDIVSRYTYVTEERILRLGASAEALLPESAGIKNVQFAVAAVYNPIGKGQKDYTVLWSKAYGGADEISSTEIQNLPTRPVILPDNNFGNEDTMIYLRMDATFDPTISVPGIVEEQTIRREAWYYPRFIERIPFVENVDELDL